MTSVLVVAAHPDDEALGCGGTVARHAEAGDRVEVVFFTDGVSSRPGSTDSDRGCRVRAMEHARLILGITRVRVLGYPDNRLDSVQLLDIVQALEAVIAEVKPAVVYTHHSGDLNVDHRVTHQAVMTACRPFPDSSIREIYSFEVPSSTDWAGPCSVPFIPNYFVEIASFLPQKIRSLEAYRDELRVAPHSRSLDHVKALSRHRGNSVGVAAAEAFMVMRISR